MRAVVYDKPRSFSVQEIPEPVPGPGDVRIKVTMAGVCGTDLHLHEGEFGPTYPLIPGHEFVGEVDQVGAAVTKLKVGDLVVCDNTNGCGACYNCRRGVTTFCSTQIARGVNAQGAFAEYIVVPEGNAFDVSDLGAEVAVFAEPNACVVHGLDMLELKPGSNALVFGAGPTGLLMAQMLASTGASKLTVAAPTQFKLDLAAEHGADEVVQVDRKNPAAAAARFKELAPHGFDVVVDATGALGVIEQTIGLTADRGTIFIYGMADEAAQWSVSPYEIFRRELTIKGSFAQYAAMDRSIAALRSGRVKTEGMITHRFGLDQYAEVLAAVADSSCVKAVIVP